MGKKESYEDEEMTVELELEDVQQRASRRCRQPDAAAVIEIFHLVV